MKKLKDLGITITGGQIISRVIADENKGDEVVVENQRTIVAKTIDKGLIEDDDVVYNNYRTQLDEKRMTKEGDIVIKLSAPYGAALVDKEHENMFVSSFCSIIRDVEGINKEYLVAFLNSDNCKRQLESSTAGSLLGVLSTGKIMDLVIPVPNETKQSEMGSFFSKTIKNRVLLEKIIKLEDEKLSSLIAEVEE